ncbi:hypothetical protein Agau_L100708 [Agrobacterium tumefaciens F2]|nr:hypothetical protein Agau_L100708 [Agrobacterium tumefaciens F2]
MNQDEKLRGRSPACMTSMDKATQLLAAIFPIGDYRAASPGV